MFLLKDRFIFEVAVALTMTWEFVFKKNKALYPLSVLMMLVITQILRF